MKHKNVTTCIVIFAVISSTVFIGAVPAKMPTETTLDTTNSSNDVTCEIESFGLEGKWVTSLASTERFLYAGTLENGLFRKDILNQNSDWIYLGFEHISIKSTYVDPSFPQIVYVGLFVNEIINESNEPHSLYKSYDGGVTWMPCDNGIEFVDPWDDTRVRLPIFCVNGVIGNALTLYATSFSQVFKSIDGGDNWDLIYGDLLTMGNGVHEIIIDPSDSETLWIGGETNGYQAFVVKSNDGGQTWVGVTPPRAFFHGDNACYSIAIDPRDSDTILAGFEGKVCKTTDGGLTWIIILSPQDYPYFSEITMNPFEPNHVYIVGRPNAPPHANPLKIWENYAGGGSPYYWSPWYCHTDDDLRPSISLVFDRCNYDILYVGTAGSGVVKFHSDWDGDIPHLDNQI